MDRAHVGAEYNDNRMISGKKNRSRRGRRGAGHQFSDTSCPTGRVAYAETRRWLLAQHGPTCAYCAVTYDAPSMTLDHVTPRRGQSAYDRRDNLVLCCRRCNASKKDTPFLAYLLAQRRRAENLLRYGSHLSEGILQNVRHLAGVSWCEPVQKAPARIVYGDDGDESPYQDSPYKASA
ncbi:MAG: hypothetical protein MNPFHGCM_02913 [Gemmatimonadaceae bacterium]|nr:hypothetical protein [Gemmatimonadaceae bacterium]